jgi:hypothetical protein
MQPKPNTSIRHAQRNAFWNAIASSHHALTCHGLPRPGVKLEVAHIPRANP